MSLNLLQIKDSDEAPFAATSNSDTFRRLATSAVSPHSQNRLVAIKGVRCSPDKQADIRRAFLVLIPTWLSLVHPNVCPLLGLHIMTSGVTSVVKPFFARGNILQCLSSLTLAMKGNIIKGVVSGLKYLHSRGLVHGNMCPTNVLITARGDPCISDSGISFLIDRITGGGRVKLPYSWPYKAPEELLPHTALSARPTWAMDTYCFGSTVYEILTGIPPFSRAMRYRGVLEIINNGHASIRQPAQINGPMWSIIQKCWRYNPILRPSMAEVFTDLESVQFV